MAGGFGPTLIGPKPGLLDCISDSIHIAVRRIRTIVAVLLAIIWLPAVSCCLIDASGLFGKQDCCEKEHSHPGSIPGNCDQPCGLLASASYLPHQDQPIVPAPLGTLFLAVVLFHVAPQPPVGVGLNIPATAPPEVAAHWQFSFRAALPPRAPSFVS